MVRRQRTAVDASREGWHVHGVLAGWGHQPKMIDTTRERGEAIER